jgi:hypothetical protein
MNQNEEGVDCGGSCQPCEEDVMAESLRVQETAIVEGTNGRYDVLVRIKNPNELFGAAQLSYTVNFLDSTGSAIYQSNGVSFILPFETKSLILQSLDVPSQPQSLQVEFDNVEWVEFRNFSEPQLRFVRKEYGPITSGPGFGQVKGLLSNDSTIDFHAINIKIILRDEKNEVIALNTHQMNTVRSSEERDFTLQFPERFDGFPKNVEAEAEADVINAENYMRIYLPGGKFQDQ